MSGSCDDSPTLIRPRAWLLLPLFFPASVHCANHLNNSPRRLVACDYWNKINATYSTSGILPRNLGKRIRSLP